jgi:hypothetical protein
VNEAELFKPVRFARGVFAYRRQHVIDKRVIAERDLVVWCTGCKAAMEFETTLAKDKTYVGFAWQRSHSRGECEFKDAVILELPL